MIISVDYDCTYTRDKILWDSFIKQAKARGHTVLCVTARCELYGDGREVKEDLEHLVDGIYFTCGAPKEKFMLDLGICVQVWIEDQCSSVVGRVYMNEWGEEFQKFS